MRKKWNKSSLALHKIAFTTKIAFTNCIFLFFVFLIFFSNAIAGPKNIIIGIGLNKKEALFSSEKGMRVIFNKGNSRGNKFSYKISGGQGITVQATSKGFKLKNLPSRLRRNRDLSRNIFTRIRVFPVGNNLVKYNSKQYRGQVEVFLNTRQLLTVTNTLGLENYLKGVVPKEMLPSSQIEALKAQAVVARTFAVRYMDKCSKEGYNLTNDTSCQVYGGFDSEDERTNRAVTLTSGRILTLNGQPISAVYNSVCGGHTANNEEVWDGVAKSYLRGVACPYCSSAKKFKWTYEIKKSVLADILRNMGIHVNNRIDSIDIISRTSGNRVKLMCLNHRGGSEYISGKEFRRIIGAAKIKSTWFDVTGSDSIKYVPVSSSRMVKNRLAIMKLRRKNGIKDRKSLDNINVKSHLKKTSSSEELIRNIIKDSMSNKKNKESGDTFLINGRGHGHGVGMCQYGAGVMAKQGKNYKQILFHYYKSVRLERMK